MTTLNGPIAIGGIGGSGTRIIAQFLQHLGVFIGSDLPVTADTIWYAALFGRRDVLLEDIETQRALSDLFFEQMGHARDLDPSERDLLAAICRQPRHQHNPPMVDRWISSFIDHTQSGRRHAVWGWKVPYTHVLIDRFLDWHADLKYIHITRNGIDMAFNKNQNQLGKWGPVFLSRNVEIGPRDSLAYWCAVHRRMARISQMFPDRIHHLDYDRLISDPRPELAAMFDFLDADINAATLDAFAAEIFIPDSIADRPPRDLSLFDPADLAYLEAHTQGGPA